MLERMRADPKLFNSILGTDDSNLRRTEIFNRYNLHYWVVNIPRTVRKDLFQDQFGNNLWADIINGVLIGPFRSSLDD